MKCKICLKKIGYDEASFKLPSLKFILICEDCVKKELKKN